ncbi:hypothetical protein FSARC_12521 [Fusarium sarcochroum]|uniref:Uncharacterized protein n=1 Tax=Fusarium sarcochroum TaxID=1208366 RepID=A0A8H4T7U7_9HYPO|nr:hypothetical protein FSARC_12521 [Fusarium sarcochroum]
MQERSHFPHSIPPTWNDNPDAQRQNTAQNKFDQQRGDLGLQMARNRPNQRRPHPLTKLTTPYQQTLHHKHPDEDLNGKAHTEVVEQSLNQVAVRNKLLDPLTSTQKLQNPRTVDLDRTALAHVIEEQENRADMRIQQVPVYQARIQPPLQHCNSVELQLCHVDDGEPEAKD